MLFEHTISGRDEQAAETLWQKQFASQHVKKDQVPAVNSSGQDIGKAWFAK